MLWDCKLRFCRAHADLLLDLLLYRFCCLDALVTCVLVQPRLDVLIQQRLNRGCSRVSDHAAGPIGGIYYLFLLDHGPSHQTRYGISRLPCPNAVSGSRVKALGSMHIFFEYECYVLEVKLLRKH